MEKRRHGKSGVWRASKEVKRKWHRDWAKAWRKAHPEEEKKKQADRKKKNPNWMRDAKRKQRDDPETAKRLKRYSKEWRKNNPDKIKGYKDAEYKKFKSIEYQCWVERFGEVCWICKGDPVDGRRLFKEHCKITGQARGLAHWWCNNALGFIYEDESIARGLVRAAKKCQEIKDSALAHGYFKIAPKLRTPMRKRKTHG